MRHAIPALSCALLLLSCAAAAPRPPQSGAAPPVTLEEAMADPSWIARSPERARWSADGTRVLYSRDEPDGSSRTWAVDLTGDGTPRALSVEEEAALVPTGGTWSPDRTRRLVTMHGDLFLAAADGGVLRQLTRTRARESGADFLLDGRIVYQRDGALLARDLETGLEEELVVLEFRDPPEDGESEDDEGDFLEQQQLRLFPHLAERAERRESAQERARAVREAVATDVAEPFYLGRGKRSAGMDLSPDGRWLLVRVQPESRDREARRDDMPVWVDESGYVEARGVRPLVGSRAAPPTTLMLLDLRQGTQREIDLSVLPGILENPLAFLDEEDDGALDAPRPVSIARVAWAPDASTVAFQARSYDNKDRWLARVDLESATADVLEHQHDEAWVQWRFSSMGWRRDSSGLWFQSEASGWAHLYLWDAATGSTRPLTAGTWEVDAVTALPDDSGLVFRANREHRGIHEVYRVGFAGGEVERLTTLGGRTSFSLSPDGTQLLLTTSSRLRPEELYVQELAAEADARRLTDTVEAAFTARDWVLPEVVEVPSRHGRPIHARVYLPREVAEGPRPAVCFVHGAGYLQNAHYGWSSYVHEFLFHQLLVSRGYVVIDADYRASAGHGRDWRTAIYRDMGRAELEDYEDAVRWLVAEHDVDAERVGIYGGSYGGFVTLMALFRKPGLFAAGAALRPVTDWAHYHHGYTAPILNTPEDDPEAYLRSSPIEFADGLEDALLICHGLIDDNVLAKDSIRLAQRLIELGKTDWELALYPVEPHGFREPSSWLDEYRRILALFESRLE